MRGVLAIDQASLAGWAFGVLPLRAITPLEATVIRPPMPLSGIYRVGRAGCSVGRFLDDAEVWLHSLIDRHQPAGLIYERAVLDTKMTGYPTAQKLIGFAGLIEMVARRRKIPWVRNGQPSSVKKLFCGSGKKGKLGVLDACRARGWDVIDDNHADALALLNYAAYLAETERAAMRVAA